MKNKLFRNCVYISAVLLLGFVGLYAYVWIEDPNPKEINSLNSPDWRSISIGHGKITIAHSLQPSNDTNRPGLLTYPEDGGGNFHFTIAKDFSGDMGGCNLIFMNQNIPYERNVSFAFTAGDNMTNETYFHDYGIEFGFGTHSTNMIGCANEDRTSETDFMGYGIFFSEISHTVDKAHNWWTLMISLWYPIILFAILPAIFTVKKLRSRQASTRKATIERPDQ